MPDPIVVSYSELDTYRQCPHKHALAYKSRWTRPTKSPALTKGTAWHAVMEAHYNAIAELKNPGHTSYIIRAFDSIDDPEVRSLITWMYDGYRRLYGLDPEWKVESVEQTYVVPLPTPSGRKSRFHLKMKIDLVVEWKGNRWVVDHKSGKDLPKSKMLEFDDQFGLYTWGLQALGLDVFGSIHNAARTFRPAPPKERKDGTVAEPKPDQPLASRFHRTPLYRTDDELRQVALDAYHTARRAYNDDVGERHPNPDTCQWRCDYPEACLHGRKTTDEREVDYLEASGFVQDFMRH